MKKILRKRNVLSLISIILSIILIVLVLKLDLLTLKYNVIFFVCLLIYNTISILLINLNGRIKNIIGVILILLLSLMIPIISYYIKVTDDFITKNSSNINNTFTYKYIIISKNNPELNNSKIYLFEDMLYKDEALIKLNDYHFNYNTYDDFNLMMSDLTLDIIDLVLVDETSYNIINELNNYNYNILYEFKIDVDDTLESKAFGKIVNIYIAGKDFTYVNNDFNMIVSIDLDNKKILLTGMPRDYYIPVYGKNGKKDTLSYMGAYGVNTSLKSLENLTGINIDYYIEINTRSLVGLVDTLGGITYCSNEEFTTTHALVLDTYKDNGKKLKVINGCQELNGIETLTVARERLNIKGGDTQRQINCYKIMMSIFDKLKSTNTIFNYHETLNSIGNLYKTNIEANDIKRFIRSLLEYNYDINYYELDGRDTKEKVHLTNYIDWVMIPNSSTIDKFKELYKEL